MMEAMMAIAKKTMTKATPAATVEKTVAPVASTAPTQVAVTMPEAVGTKGDVASKEAPAFPFTLQADILKPINAMQEQLRLGAEKSVEQLRTQYATLKGNAETATDKLEESIAAAQAGTRAFQTKVLDIFRAQSDANFTHVRTLFAATTLTDALKIQQDFVKAQAESLQEQTRALTELAQKVTQDIAEPVKASISASFAR